MKRTLILIAVILLETASVHGQVSVELVNMPTEVYSFGPAYVLYAVENTGRTPIYLPAERAPRRGPGIYVGRYGEPPRPIIHVYAERIFEHAVRTMWLAPGERWLFYQDISTKIGILEGEVTIQAVMSSEGRCGDDVIYGRSDHPLEGRHLETARTGVSTAEVYRCWKGEVRSSAWTLHVRKPDGPVDEAAWDYLIQKRGLSEDREQGTWSLRWASGLDEKYPQSHYTYAVKARQTSVYSKKDAIELQPDHPSNPWVMAEVARMTLERRAPCTPEMPREIDLDIDTLELPDSLHAFLDQHKWFVEHRLCAKKPAEKGSDRKPGSPEER